MAVHVGGSELNTAVAAARLGLSVGYVTRLTKSPLGRLVENKAREHGVDTSAIAWTQDDRIGTYYVEFGAAPRANSVLYDRANSAIARIQPEDVDWSQTLKGVRVFHTSGITPALSLDAANTTLKAAQTAKDEGALVSVDLNYRARLWSQDEARVVMTEIAQLAGIMITTEEDTERVFSMKASSYEAVAEQLAKRFSLQHAAITLRETPTVWRNQWTAIVFEASTWTIHRAPTFDIEVVDRVGLGDAFAGGFLYGILRHGAAQAVRYGVAMSK